MCHGSQYFGEIVKCVDDFKKSVQGYVKPFLGASQAPDCESLAGHLQVSKAEIKEPFGRLERPLSPYAAPQWLGGQQAISFTVHP
jgi:hypothetical protein